MWDRIGEVWRGEVSLARTYWLYGVLLAIALNFFFLMAIALWAYGHGDRMVMVAFSQIFLHLAFTIWISVGIFRSAKRYAGPKIWSILARVVVIGGWLYNAGVVIEIMNASW